MHSAWLREFCLTLLPNGSRMQIETATEDVMKPINIKIPESLKERLDLEAEHQRRSQRAIVEIALERYFQEIDNPAYAGREIAPASLAPHRESLL